MKPVEIRRAALRDVCFVAAHMRAEDRREALCQFTPDTSMLELAASSHGGSGLVYCAWYRGSPVAAFGAAPASHAGTVWSAWLFGTRRLARAVPEIGRFGRETLSARLIEKGVRRVEVRSIEGHDIAHAWLARLGARREARMHDYGRDGETFTLWSWTLKDWSSTRCA